jgi:O-antigen/teichoic acid export membrane protein
MTKRIGVLELRDVFSLRGFGGTLASQIGIGGLGVASGVILARTLGPAGRGDLAAAVQWAGLALTLADMGIGFSIAHAAGASPARRGELWWFGLAVAALGGGLIAIAASTVMPHFVQASAAPALGVSVWVVPFALAAGFQSYLLLGSGGLLAQNAVRLGGTVAYVAGTGILALKGFRTAVPFAFAYVLAQVLAAFLAFAFLSRSLKPSRMKDAAFAGSLFRTGLKNQVASIAAQTSLRLDQLLLSLMVPSAELGLYVVAVAAAGLVSPLFTASAIVVVPRLNQIRDAGAASRAIRREVATAALVCVPIVGLMFFSMPLILRILFGAGFSSSLVAARILVIASLFQGMNALLGNAMRSIGRPGGPAKAEGAGMIVTLALLFILLPRLGTVGAAIASLCAYACVSLAYGYLLSTRRLVSTVEAGQPVPATSDRCP